MKKKLKIKIAIIILLIISALVLFFTGTYDYLKIKVINYFENTVNRTGLELIKGTGSLIDKAALGSLEDSGIKGEEYNFNNIDNPYYAILEDDEKRLYKQIYANMIKKEKNFKPVITVNRDSINDTIEAVFNDHPEIFWINTNYSYKYISDGKVVQMTISYNSTSKNLEESKKIFEESANKIIDKANTYSTIYEKEKYVHDTLIEMNKYDENEKLNQSAYSALVKGKTVCAGYSRAFQYIMNKLGITTYYITGDSAGDHSWNIIELENEFYNVDLTWDDQKITTYRYFNVPDSVFSKTHIRKDLSIYLPVCRGNKYYNYESKIKSTPKPAYEEEIAEPKREQEKINENDSDYNQDEYEYEIEYYEDKYEEEPEENDE